MAATQPWKAGPQLLLDMPETPSDITVPGLSNIGNTCYLNAALQAIASSHVLCDYVAKVAAALQRTRSNTEQAATVTKQLIAGLKAGWNFMIHGPDDSDHTAEVLAARAAQGHLTTALHCILTRLQAHKGLDDGGKASLGFSSSRGGAVNPSALLSALTWHIPEGVLERGYQHDVAEALEVVCDAVCTEVTCWQQQQQRQQQQRQQQQRQQQQQAVPGLESLLLPHSCQQQQQVCHHANSNNITQQCWQQQRQEHKPQQQQQQQVTALLLSGSILQRSPHLPTPPIVQLGEQQLLVQQQQQQQHCVCAPLGQLPVIGHTVDIITCLTCGYRFPRSLTPFMTFPLTLPATLSSTTGQLTVPWGLELSYCLAQYSQAEVVEGVECLRCSLGASLAAAAEQGQHLPVPAAAAAAAAAAEQGQHLPAPAAAEQGQHLPVPAAAAGHGRSLNVPSAETATPPAAAAAATGQAQHISMTAAAAPQATVSKHDDTSSAESTHQTTLSLLHYLNNISPQTPLPPLDYPQLLESASGLQWLNRKRTVKKQTCIAKAPKVLLLQLQRSVHVGGGGAKVQGHVRFPLVLEMLEYVLQEQGPQQQQQQQQQQDQVQELQEQQQSQTQQQQQQQQEALQSIGKQETESSQRSYPNHHDQQQYGAGLQEPRQQQQQQQHGAGLQETQQQQQRVGPQQQLQYHLTAVVQHLGLGQASGHYIMYRRVTQQQLAAAAAMVVSSTAAAAAASDSAFAAGGTHDAQSFKPNCQCQQQVGSSSVQCYWFRVNDSSVNLVDEQEVLQCHATLLVYERQFDC